MFTGRIVNEINALEDQLKEKEKVIFVQNQKLENINTVHANEIEHLKKMSVLSVDAAKAAIRTEMEKSVVEATVAQKEALATLAAYKSSEAEIREALTSVNKTTENILNKITEILGDQNEAIAAAIAKVSDNKVIIAAAPSPIVK